MYIVKDLQVLNLHPTLIELYTSVAEEFGLYVITSAYRPNDLGVHGTHPLIRGLDIRCRNPQIGEEIAWVINQMWVYDPARPEMKVAVWHKNHLHLQVHHSTVRKS